MKFRKENGSYLVVLDKGDEVIASLTGLVQQEKLEGGFIRGIGGVSNVTLGFFDLEKKEYSKKQFPGFYELASLVGDISLVDEKPFCHLHAVISDPQMNTFAGHLFFAEISITGEIAITPFNKTQRLFNKDLGLNLIRL